MNLSADLPCVLTRPCLHLRSVVCDGKTARPAETRPVHGGQQLSAHLNKLNKLRLDLMVYLK
jgi:hypothetical protein